MICQRIWKESSILRKKENYDKPPFTDYIFQALIHLLACFFYMPLICIDVNWGQHVKNIIRHISFRGKMQWYCKYCLLRLGNLLSKISVFVIIVCNPRPLTMATIFSIWKNGLSCNFNGYFKNCMRYPWSMGASEFTICILNW